MRYASLWPHHKIDGTYIRRTVSFYRALICATLESNGEEKSMEIIGQLAGKRKPSPFQIKSRLLIRRLPEMAVKSISPVESNSFSL